MKKRLLVIGMAILLVLGTILAGCGSSLNKEEYYTGETMEPGGYGSYDQEMEVPDIKEDGNFTANGSSAVVGPSSTQVISSEKLVYTCTLEMESLEYEKSLQAIRELIVKHGGFVENEKITDNERDWYYSEYVKNYATLTCYMTIRIPTTNYEAFLAEAEGNGKVITRDSNVKNITKRYTETETTIKSLQIQEERLLQMMKEATTIRDMLDVEDRLTEVQNELAQYKNTLATMDSMVQFSTVNLTLREVVEYTPEQTPKKTATFGERLKNTLKDSWEGFTGFLEDFLFFLIEAFPFLVIFVFAPLVVMILVIRKAKARKAKAKAEKEKAMQDVTASETPVDR